MRTILFLTFALAACTSPPPPIQPAARPISSILLEAHNRERAAAGVPPLVWDGSLENAAATYARQLAGVGALRHSPRQARPGQGENLWMGTRGAFSPQLMIASWSAERARFRPGIFPSVSRTGNWADVGHYSQMIWPTTREVGCAISSSARADLLVCRYAPAGNIDGRRVP
jgi:hypothetical protein